MTAERWRWVRGYEGYYEVSDRGRVRSVTRIGNDRTGKLRIDSGRVLRPGMHKGGYLVVCFSVKRARRMFRVHCLVAEAFIGPCPTGHQVAHGDGNPAHNHVGNLRYATRPENEADKLLHGTHNRGERHGNARLTADAVREIRARVAAGERQTAVAAHFDVGRRTVSSITHRRTWAWLADADQPTLTRGIAS